MPPKTEAAQIESFKLWLTRCGAEVLTPTNEWEVVRFRAGGETSIIYTNGRGHKTYTGAAAQAWEMFTTNKPYRFTVATPKPTTSRSVVERTLIARDGLRCFYCGDLMYDADGRPLTGDAAPSREHLVPRSQQGPDNLANTFLACVACNTKADSLSAVEKIRLREQLHAARAARSHALDDRIGGGGIFGQPLRPEETQRDDDSNKV